jgi:hypothetical protein
VGAASSFENDRECRSRLSGNALSNFRRTTKNDLNSDARVAEHGDQRVNTESVDLASHEVADSWLRDTKEICGLRLGQASGLDQLAQPNHQVGSDLEVRRFLS